MGTGWRRIGRGLNGLVGLEPGLRGWNHTAECWELIAREIGERPVAGTLGSPAAFPFQVTLRCRETTVAPRAPMKRIFVVDDNAAIRELVLELVSSFGYAGLGVDDGAELLQLLEESVPDLVVMDVRMPNVDGLEAIRRIRANAGLKNLRVIALTASAMRGDREAGLRSGFDAYLTKPIDPELLRKEIERLLAAP